jgi:hypothetical protein
MLSTGGAAVGASFLLAGFVTDRRLVDAIHDWHRLLGVPARTAVVWAGRLLGVVGLAGVVVVGFLGEPDPLSNAAVLVVWAGWWAGFTMTAYLAGNVWPVVNPWRTISAVFPAIGREYEWRYGAWASVAGLLALVWLEVVSPLADDPELLATTVLAYSLVTLAGATVYGTTTWFVQVDPVSRVFRAYGRVAPLTTDDGRLRLRFPGTALSEAGSVEGLDEVAFVVALLWATTFDGFVTTPLWDDIATTLVTAGFPPVLLYPVAMVVGFLAFFALYLGAARLARRTGETYVSSLSLAERFAPSLLAIAAGYHLAHFLGYFLTLAPTLVDTVAAPLSEIEPTVVILPDWFGLVAIAGVLGGHLLAIWAAHAAALDLFPGRLQAIRSQYPFIAVMVWYTMVSLWVVTRPDVQLPYV